MLICLAAFLVYLLWPAQRLGYLSFASIGVYLQLLVAQGTFSQLDRRVPADVLHASLITVVFVFIVFTLTILTAGRRGKPIRFAGEVATPPLTWGFWSLLAVSGAVCVAYYVAVGYLPFIDALTATLSGSDEDVAGLRLASYAGGRYLFPGYVNQFKNAIYPCMVVVAITTLYRAQARWRLQISVALSISAVLFLIGTGQRGALVVAVGVVGLYLLRLDPTQAPRRIAYFLAVMVPVLLLGTFALGRSSEQIAESDSFWNKVTVVSNELLVRMLSGSQSGAVLGFRYVYEQETQWGADWLRSILGLLPGVRYSSLDSVIFEIKYGSTRGTTPPSVWTSAYYNWGFVGAVLFAGLYAVCLYKLSTAIAGRKTITALELLGRIGVGLLFSLWVSGAPIYLFNRGLPGFVFLWYLGYRQMKKQERTEGRDLVSVEVRRAPQASD